MQCLEINNNFYRGKVRNVFYPQSYSNYIILEHSDRLSAYDSHICNVEDKGLLLNYTNAFWMNLTQHIIPNHYLYHSGKYLLAKRCNPIKLEVIVRGYITGSSKTSLWTLYQKGEHGVYGITLPEGLKQHQKLERPIVTPTTKGDIDIPCNDEYITNPDNKLLTNEQWQYIKGKALALYNFGANYCLAQNLILVDTKYEFGFDTNTNEIMLIDECHTCDSSRYWKLDTYNQRMVEEVNPDNLDKDQARRWIDANYPEFKSQELSERPKLDVPEKCKQLVYNTYLDLYEKLTGYSLQSNDVKSKDFIYGLDFLQYYLDNIASQIVIMSGSTSDAPYVNKVNSYCNELGVPTRILYHSAHKEPQVVLKLIKELNDEHSKGRKLIVITVVGMSNALGGVLGANLNIPVINCPVFKDQVDMMVNIHSNIQMPSKVPVATILNARNAVLFAKRILDL